MYIYVNKYIKSSKNNFNLQKKKTKGKKNAKCQNKHGRIIKSKKKKKHVLPYIFICCYLGDYSKKFLVESLLSVHFSDKTRVLTLTTGCPFKIKYMNSIATT